MRIAKNALHPFAIADAAAPGFQFGTLPHRFSLSCPCIGCPSFILRAIQRGLLVVRLQALLCRKGLPLLIGNAERMAWSACRQREWQDQKQYK
ncbi:hypothetical protein MASR1M60_30280 [Rhodocyclaceae bacterium]